MVVSTQRAVFGAVASTRFRRQDFAGATVRKLPDVRAEFGLEVSPHV